MTFFTEPPGYQKTVLSDLQGAWEVLRATVVEQAGFDGWQRLLFHIDEAMSWETVRHLERMAPLVVLIRNLAVQGHAPAEVMDALAEITELLQEIEQGPETWPAAVSEFWGGDSR
jgi:hypothetical protein